MSNFLKSGDFIGGSSQFLNDIADTVASGQPDALGVLPGTSYGGGLNTGDYIRLTDVEAKALSDTVTGTLFGGLYRRVLLKSGITGGGNTGFKRGQMVFWDVATSGADPYQVTNVEATDVGIIAGYILNANDTAGAPLSGKYVWIQVAGAASCLFRGTITGAAQFNAVVWSKAGAGADNATVDALAVSTDPVTLAAIMNIVGIATVLPVNATVTRVELYDWRCMYRM